MVSTGAQPRSLERVECGRNRLQRLDRLYANREATPEKWRGIIDGLLGQGM